MRRQLQSLLALGGLIALFPQSGGAQQLDSLSVGFRNPAVRATASPRADGPSTLTLGGKSAGWAFLSAVTGASAGLIVDDAYCDQRHGDEPVIFFGPCFLYTGAGTTVGWFGGAVVGATVGAARVARERGCPSRAARTRALAGAVLGAAPGLIIVAGRPGKYPPARTALVFGAPLLSAIGATAAVANCRGT